MMAVRILLEITLLEIYFDVKTTYYEKLRSKTLEREDRTEQTSSLT